MERGVPPVAADAALEQAPMSHDARHQPVVAEMRAETGLEFLLIADCGRAQRMAAVHCIREHAPEQQSRDLLQAMRLMFPEAVILVREAREGFGTS